MKTGGQFDAEKGGQFERNIHYSGTNRLAYVTDTVNAANYTDDIDNQSTGNFTYDAIGNLTSDTQGDIAAIDWTVYGKIRSIDKATGNDMHFAYSTDGQRITKYVDSTYTFYVRDANGNIMATYTHKTKLSEDCFTMDAHDIYGSSRLGMRQTEVCMEDEPTPDPLTDGIIYVYRGYKRYELSNHLGNVLTVITDRRDCFTHDTTVYYEADVISVSDYYPFGSAMSGRTNSSDKYRFGFNGKENDGETSTQDYGMRIYNHALARFLTVDPIAREYPELTPYQFASNRPIDGIDLDGLEFRSTKGMYIFYASAQGFPAKNSIASKITSQDINYNLIPKYYKDLGVKDAEGLKKQLSNWEQVSKRNDGPENKNSTPQSDVISASGEYLGDVLGSYSLPGQAYDDVKTQQIQAIQTKVLVDDAQKQGLLPSVFDGNGEFYADLQNYIFDGTMPTIDGAKGKIYANIIKTLGKELYNNREDIYRNQYKRPVDQVVLVPTPKKNIDVMGYNSMGVTNVPVILAVPCQNDIDSMVNEYKNTPGDIKDRTTKIGPQR